MSGKNTKGKPISMNLSKVAIGISAAVTGILLLLFLTGVATADEAGKKALGQGNKQYALGQFQDALQAYETGLAADPNSSALRFNAGQAAYRLGDYEKALAYYADAPENMEKHLHVGNAAFRLGESTTDMQEKIKHFRTALDAYYTGICLYPQNVPLKYNYENLKALLESLGEESAQDGSNDEGSDDGESSEDAENSEGSEDGGSGEDGDSQDQDGRAEDEDQSDASQGPEDGAEDGAEDNPDGQNEGQDGEAGQAGSYSQEEMDSDEQDRQAIERILQMLEAMEEESLKNNREVVGGNGGSYDW